MARPMKQIVVRKTPKGWEANFIDNPELMSLFGTTKVMTAWTANAPAEKVIDGLQELNPDSIIILV